MRILYIGQGQGFDGPRKYYFIPQKLINGFTRLGHHVVAINDRDVSRYLNVFRSQAFGARAMNSYVLDMFRAYRPDLVLLGHCKNVTNDTLMSMRTIVPDVRIAYRNVDPLTSTQNVEDIKQRVGVVDSIFITTAGEPLRSLSHASTLVSYMPNPVDPALETGAAYANDSADIDLLFLAASLRDQTDHRAITARFLDRNRGALNFYLAGAGMNDNLVFGASFFDLLNRSKMGLCVNKTSEHYLYASDRMSQYMGSGVLTFIPEGPRFEDVLGNDTFVSFRTDEELIEKVRYYAKNDTQRIRIAENGRARVHDLFLVDKVCQYILEHTFRKAFSQCYRWPTEAY